MKNIRLLTKEAINDMKKKSLLFFCFLIFLMFGIAFSIGIFQFYSTFWVNGKVASDPRQSQSFEYQLTPKRLDMKDLDFIKSDKFTKYVYEKTTTTEDTWDSLEKSNFFAKYENQNKNENQNEFYNNILIDYIYNCVLDSGVMRDKYKKSIIADRQNGLYNATKINIVDYNLKNIDQLRFNTLRLTSKIDNFDEFSDKEKNVIVGSTFLKYHHLKLGDKISFSYKNRNFSDYKIIGSGYMSRDAFKTNVNIIYLNHKEYFDAIKDTIPDWVSIPIFNKSIEKNYSPDKLIKVFSEDQKYFKTKFQNAFWGNSKPTIRQEQFMDYFCQVLNFNSTPKFEFNNQMFIYKIVSILIASIVLIVVVISYFFVEKYTINKNLQKLSFLKSLGFTNAALVYYIIFSSLAFVLITALFGYAFSLITYIIFVNTIGYNNSFVLQGYPAGFVFYIAFGFMLLCICSSASFITYFSISGSKLSIHNKKISNFELLILKIKDNKLVQKTRFAPMIAFQVSNLFKAIFVLVITCVALSGLGLSLQLSSGIDKASKNFYKPVFHDNKSAGYMQYKDWQYTRTYKGKILSDKNYKILNEYTIEKVEKLINTKYPPNDFWFNHLGDIGPLNTSYISSETTNYIMKELEKNKDEEIVKNNATLFNLVNYYKTYKDTFGTDAVDPVITFKNWITPENYKPDTSIWNTDKGRVYGELNSKLNVGKIKPTNDKDLPGISINYNFASQKNLHVGDQVQLFFKAEKSEYFNFAIQNINYRLLNKNEFVISQKTFNAILNKIGKKDIYNSVFTKEKTPWTIKFLTIPLMNNDNNEHTGEKFADYYIQGGDPSNDLTLNYISLPVITNIIKNLVSIYYSLILLATYGMIIFTILMLLVIDLIIIAENKRTLLVLKTLGYSRVQTVFLILSIYPLVIVLSYFISIFASAHVIDALSDTILEKMGLRVNSVFDTSITLIPLIFAVAFTIILIYSLVLTYRRIKVEDISSFAE